MVIAADKLTKLAQIELQCVQGYASLFDGPIPEPACNWMYQHAEAAHCLSELLLKEYGIPLHGHRPSALILRKEVCANDHEG